MFKERLKITGKFIFGNIFVPLLIITLIVAIAILMEDKLFELIDTILWVGGLFVGAVLLTGFIIFVHWLFIEPFKKNSRESK